MIKRYINLHPNLQRLGTFQKIKEALHFRGAYILNAVGVKLTALPVVEGEASFIGDGLLALSYTQAAETAGVIVKLVIAAVVLHLRQLIRVDERGGGRSKELGTAHGLNGARGQAQCQNQYGNKFFHTQHVIPQHATPVNPAFRVIGVYEFRLLFRACLTKQLSTFCMSLFYSNPKRGFAIAVYLVNINPG